MGSSRRWPTSLQGESAAPVRSSLLSAPHPRCSVLLCSDTAAAAAAAANGRNTAAACSVEIALRVLCLSSPLAVEADAGDLIIWNRLLPHGNGRNTSHTPRLAQVCAFGLCFRIYFNRKSWIRGGRSVFEGGGAPASASMLHQSQHTLSHPLCGFHSSSPWPRCRRLGVHSLRRASRQARLCRDGWTSGRSGLATTGVCSLVAHPRPQRFKIAC